MDPDGPEWPQQLAQQERAAANNGDNRLFTLYTESKDDSCSRHVIGRSQLCGGTTVIRSKGSDTNVAVHDRLFIGCSNYQHREKGHMLRPLDGFDPIAVLRLWGRDRCYVHKDILDALKFSWDESPDEGMFCSSDSC